MATFLQASYVWLWWFVMTKHAPIMSNCTKEVCMIPRESAVLCILHFKLALCVKSEPDLWVSLCVAQPDRLVDASLLLTRVRTSPGSSV